MTRLTASQQTILSRHCRGRNDLHPLFGRERRSGYALERKGLGRVVTTQEQHEIWIEGGEGSDWVRCMTNWYFKMAVA